jgi:hypothetical protein
MPEFCGVAQGCGLCCVYVAGLVTYGDRDMCHAMLKTAADFSISLRAVLQLWPQAMPALRLEVTGGI